MSQKFNRDPMECACALFAVTPDNYLEPIEDHFGMEFHSLGEVMRFVSENELHHPRCPEHGIEKHLYHVDGEG